MRESEQLIYSNINFRNRRTRLEFSFPLHGGFLFVDFRSLVHLHGSPLEISFTLPPTTIRNKHLQLNENINKNQSTLKLRSLARKLLIATPICPALARSNRSVEFESAPRVTVSINSPLPRRCSLAQKTCWLPTDELGSSVPTALNYVLMSGV